MNPEAAVAQAGSTVQWIVDTAIEYSLPVLGAFLILIIGWFVAGWVAKLVKRGLVRAKLDEALARFLSQMARYAVLVMTVIAMLSTVGIETTSFVAVLASVGFAVGMALQGTLGHFASGVMILIFQPIRLGEVVTAGGETGVVHDIGLFATTLLTPQNRTVIIANSAITGGNITNFSRQGTLRSDIAVGVAYGADLKQVEDVCRKAAASVEGVLSEPGMGFAFTEMAASSLNFNLMVWSAAADRLRVQHEVRSAVYNALNEADIEIPFNQIVVHRADQA